MTGKIILIEGPECVGKSTLALDLQAHMKLSGQSAQYFHCPRGTEAAQSIMKVIDRYKRSMDPSTVDLLIAATHIENINEMLRVRDMGRNVICDRSLLSFFAYQGPFPDGFDNWLMANDIPEFVPDVVLLLTATPEEIVRRLGLRKGKQDVMDEFFLENMKDIISAYERYDEVYDPGLVRTIDTTNLKAPQALQEALRVIAEVN